MQNNKVKIWLEHIKASIIEINEFISAMNYFAFQHDKRTQAAVERVIEIIGEAMIRIIKVDPGIAITDSRKIIEASNTISYNYERVTPETIWEITKKYLPILDKEVKALLEN